MRLNGGRKRAGRTAAAQQSDMYEDEEVTNRMREVTKYSVAWCTWIEWTRTHTNLYDSIDRKIGLIHGSKLNRRWAFRPVRLQSHQFAWNRCTECDTGVLKVYVIWNAVHVQSSHWRTMLILARSPSAANNERTIYSLNGYNRRIEHNIQCKRQMNGMKMAHNFTSTTYMVSAGVWALTRNIRIRILFTCASTHHKAKSVQAARSSDANGPESVEKSKKVGKMSIWFFKLLLLTDREQ